MNPALQDILLQLFEQVHHDPDSLPVVPMDEWQEGSTERQLLISFSIMMEQVQQRVLQLRRAGEQLREREEQYRSIFEATTDAMAIASLEDGIIVEVNPAECRMFGYTYEEMIGMHPAVTVHPDSLTLVTEANFEIQAGNQFQTQALALRKDGTPFPVEAYLTPFIYKGNPHTLSVARDITGRVEAEQQLREREEQYRSVFEATYDGLIISNLDGFVVEVNPAFCSMYGYTREELLGLHVGALAATESLPVLDEVLERRKTGMNYQTVVAQAMRKDGTAFSVESHGTTFTYRGQPHTLGIVRDITERIEAEKQLREKEEQYRSIFEAVTDSLTIARQEDGQIVEVNPAACKMLGYSYEELIGKFPADLVPPDFLPLVAEGLQEIQVGERNDPPPMVALRKDGSSILVEAHSTQFTYKEKPHHLTVSRDITEHVEAEQQLREREEQYRSVFEATGDGLFVIDLDGFIVEANPAAYRQLGYTYEEIIGLHRSTIVNPKYHSLVPEYLRVIQMGDQFQGRAIDVRKDGTTFPVEVLGRAFTYKGRPHTLSVVRDITKQVQAEEQLREREEQYRSIFEATSDALLIRDLEDGHVVEANPAACQMYGYSYEEFIGLAANVITHPDSLRLVPEGLQTVREGHQLKFQGIGLRKDGSSIHVEARGTPFTYKGKPHILGVSRDITEQVQAQQLLEQRVEERTRELASLLEISHTVASTLQLKPLLGLILDQLKTVVDYTSAAILTVEGDDMVLLDSRSPTPEEQLRQIRFLPQRLGPIWEMITSGQSIRLTDMRDESPLAQTLRVSMGELMDTTFSYVRGSLFVPLTLKDSVIGMLVLTSSEAGAFTPHHTTLALAIANQAAIAIENARLYEQAQELAVVEERQRLARELHDSVSQALYGISLGVHTARMQLDRDPRDLAESLDYVLELAEAALIEMRALIFELRPESLEAEGLVTALSKQAAALQARQNISVNTELCAEPDLPLKVKQDLYRVAQEALHNTVKHARASKIELRLHLTNEDVILEVCDNGKGFNATASFPGHLGLHSMHERVRSLGGELQIESVPGQGTCIRAQVPKHEAM